jgi:hypothetical protein
MRSPNATLSYYQEIASRSREKDQNNNNNNNNNKNNSSLTRYRNILLIHTYNVDKL